MRGSGRSGYLDHMETWRIIATWPSGKATAQAIWDLDKGRQVVSPHDDMAQYLCAERPTQMRPALS